MEFPACLDQLARKEIKAFPVEMEPKAKEVLLVLLAAETSVMVLLVLLDCLDVLVNLDYQEMMAILVSLARLVHKDQWVDLACRVSLFRLLTLIKFIVI